MSNKQTLIKKLGSEEAYIEYMRDLASRPRKSSRGGFNNPEIASLAGKKSKRGKAKNNA